MPATLGGWHLAVSKYSKNAEAATDLVMYLTSAEEQKRRAVEGSFNPTIQSLYERRRHRQGATPSSAIWKASSPTRSRARDADQGQNYNKVSTEFFNAVHRRCRPRRARAGARTASTVDLKRIKRGGWRSRSDAVARRPASGAAPGAGRRDSLDGALAHPGGVVFIAPRLCVLALVAGWPLAPTIWFSFTDADLNEPLRLRVHRLRELSRRLTTANGSGAGLDPDWWHAVWNTVWFRLVSVSIETVLGHRGRAHPQRRVPGRGLVRAAILIPWAIPTIVSAKMWNWMLHDQFGVVNDMLLRLGLIAAPIAWTANPDTALWRS